MGDDFEVLQINNFKFSNLLENENGKKAIIISKFSIHPNEKYLSQYIDEERKRKKIGEILIKNKIYLVIIFMLIFAFLSGVAIHISNKFYYPPKSRLFPDNRTNEKSFEISYSRKLEARVIYLCINNINFLFKTKVKNIDENHTEQNYNAENVSKNQNSIIESIKRAYEVGITNIVIPETSIDIMSLKERTVFKELVTASKIYNVTISILLNGQFSIPYEIKFPVSKKIYALDSNNRRMFSEWGFILNPSSVSVKLFIEKRIKELTECGINNFYLYDNPVILKAKKNQTVRNGLGKEIDIKLFSERSNFILNKGKDINLFYLYEDEKFKERILETKIKYHGSIYRIRLSSSEFDELNTSSLTKMFQYLESENKVLLLDTITFDFNFHYINILFGLYLFSPVSIILRIENHFWHNFFQVVLTGIDVKVNNRFAKLNNAFYYVLMVIKRDFFFKYKTKLLEPAKYYNGIISAIIGIVDYKKKSYVLMMLYRKRPHDINVNLQDIFRKYTINCYKVLFGGSEIDRSSSHPPERKLYLPIKNLLIIRAQINHPNNEGNS